MMGVEPTNMNDSSTFYRAVCVFVCGQNHHLIDASDHTGDVGPIELCRDQASLFSDQFACTLQSHCAACKRAHQPMRFI